MLVHYMPWYTAPPHSGGWGWHWTMNHFDPEQAIAGRQQIASHYRPLIGPYDSGDPAVLEYHLLLMKLAGIDGVIVDWYGRADHFDYATIHCNTQALVSAAEKIGLLFAICYEDQTIPKLIEAKKLAAGDRVSHAQSEIEWLAHNWFNRPGYVRLDGRPLLLSFGFAGLTDEEWAKVLDSPPDRWGDRLLYASEHRQRPSSAGAFDWPIPNDFPASLDRFEAQARTMPLAIPVAFPRFHDIYQQARVGPSYGSIADDDGKTWEATLARALQGETPVVQIATWNDWGEGTGIEPTEEFGYRDLESLQRGRRAFIEPAFAFDRDDLRLPHRLLQLRRQQPVAHEQPELDRIAGLIAQGKTREATFALQRLERRTR